jgi:hypothetical protein
MGYIYLLECSDNDETVYKIGYTKYKDSKKRIKNLQTGNKDEIKEVYMYESKYNQKLESVIHRQFTQNRCKKGEWFKLDLKNVVDFIPLCERIEKNFDVLKDNPFLFKY